MYLQGAWKGSGRCQVQVSQNSSSQDSSSQDRSGQDSLSQDRSSQDRSGQVPSGQVNLRMEFDSGVGPTCFIFIFEY